LAFSAQKAGLNVLLIDCDLRHPTITKFFKLEAASGLVDLLTGSAREETVFVKIDGITVLPAGTKSQNPPDLLSSERMKNIIENLRESFDYIVVDTPPAGLVIDAKILAPIVDKIVYVVRWGSTPRELVSQKLSEFGRDRKLAGVLLTLVDEAKTPRYGQYSHYSGYYYNKYYKN